MKVLKVNLYFLLILCLMASSCKKEDPQPTTTTSSNSGGNTNTIQGRLDNGETPKDIWLSDVSLMDSLYGKTYQGGIIFYLNVIDGSGIVAATADQGTLYWGCQGTSITGTSTATGSGLQNTMAIIAGCMVADIAAFSCYVLVQNGYDDWYLPSRNELNYMHANLHLNGLGNFALSSYWSSSQYDSQNAHLQFFNSNTNQFFYDKELLPYRVRAVRSF